MIPPLVKIMFLINAERFIFNISITIEKEDIKS